MRTSASQLARLALFLAVAGWLLPAGAADTRPDKKKSLAALQRGKKADDTGQRNEAIAAYSEAIQADASNVEAWRARGIHFGAFQIQVDRQAVIVDGALGFSDCRKKLAASQVVLRAARLCLDRLVEIGLRLLAVVRGLVIAPARPPRLHVGRVRLDCLGIGRNRLVALPRIVRFLAALQGRQRFLLIGPGVCRAGGKKPARHGQKQGQSR